MRSIKPQEKTAAELRHFASVMCLALAVIAGLLIWKERRAALIPIALISCFLLTGLFAPAALRPVEKVWMALGKRLGIISTAIILTLLYYLCFVPLGLFLRLIGKDLLNLRRQPGRTTYWVPVDKGQDRPFLPY